jgi:hypothetical protein
MVACDTTPYSGCKYSKRVVEALIKAANVRNFVETGTFLGHTTRDVATTFPHLNIHTVELVFSTFKKNEDSFKNFKNIKAVNGDSCKFLKDLTLDDGPTLYYLDAHWGDSHPLREELAIIRDRAIGNEIIVIDDFQVPNRPFGYDWTPSGQVYNLEWIDGILGDDWVHFYKDQQDNDERATGQIFIFHKNLNLKRFIKYENNIPYSSLES